MAFESTQYDAIGDKYNDIKVLPFSFFERSSVRAAIEPNLSSERNTSVLDLACGTGFISRSLIDWGAGSVLGVDISSGMIDAARADNRSQDEGRLKYVVGDARGLQALDHDGNETKGRGGQFDMVIGTWMLNYAENVEEMTEMWKSVHTNLKDGGVFVGVVPKAEDDLEAVVARRANFNAEHPAYFGATWEHPRKLENGQGFLGRMKGHGSRPFAFEWFHLRKDIHEKAARAAGMKGKFEWKDSPLQEVDRRRASAEYWERYAQSGGHFSILVAEK